MAMLILWTFKIHHWNYSF